MKITGKMKLGDVMRTYPDTTQIFLKYGVCNCCGGDNTIEKAAKAHGADLKKLLLELNRGTG